MIELIFITFGLIGWTVIGAFLFLLYSERALDIIRDEEKTTYTGLAIVFLLFLSAGPLIWVLLTFSFFSVMLFDDAV